MIKKQSRRLTTQHKHSQGVVGIFGEEAQFHDAEVGETSLIVMEILKEEYPNSNLSIQSSINPVFSRHIAC